MLEQTQRVVFVLFIFLVCVFDWSDAWHLLLFRLFLVVVVGGGGGDIYRMLQAFFFGLGTFFLRTSRTKFSNTAVTFAPVSALVSM